MIHSEILYISERNYSNSLILLYLTIQLPKFKPNPVQCLPFFRANNPHTWHICSDSNCAFLIRGQWLYWTVLCLCCASLRSANISGCSQARTCGYLCLTRCPSKTLIRKGKPLEHFFPFKSNENKQRAEG